MIRYKYIRRKWKIPLRKVKEDTFQVVDLVLKWDAPHEDKGNHGKFDHLWVVPYIIAAHRGNNAFIYSIRMGLSMKEVQLMGYFWNIIWNMGKGNFMYYSVNTSLLSISIDGELENFKPTEKALRLEGVAIFYFLYFF